jgi:hypothetical protein
MFCFPQRVKCVKKCQFEEVHSYQNLVHFPLTERKAVSTELFLLESFPGKFNPSARCGGKARLIKHRKIPVFVNR